MSNMNPAEKLDTILTQNVVAGQFVITRDNLTVFEAMRSGDVIPSSFAPDVCIYRVYHNFLKAGLSRYTKGDIVEDYFNSEFYGPFTREQIDMIIQTVVERQQEMDSNNVTQEK